MQQDNFLQFNNGKDFFAFTVNNTNTAAAKIILFPSYNPSDPNKVIRSGNVTGFPVTGSLAALNFVAGAGGVNGNYPGIPVLGGTGAGAIVTILVIAGAVSAITVTNAGDGYTVGDALNVNPALIGNVVGFSFTPLTVTVTKSVSGASATEKSIEEFLSYIDKYATECTALQIATNNNLLLHQLLNIIPREPYKNLENKIIPLSQYANENAPNQNIININDQIIPLDNGHEINITIPPATSATFTLVCRDALI